MCWLVLTSLLLTIFAMCGRLSGTGTIFSVFINIKQYTCTCWIKITNVLDLDHNLFYSPSFLCLSFDMIGLIDWIFSSLPLLVDLYSFHIEAIFEVSISAQNKAGDKLIVCSFKQLYVIEIWNNNLSRSPEKINLTIIMDLACIYLAKWHIHPKWIKFKFKRPVHHFH